MHQKSRQDVKLFKFVLKNLPMVEASQDVVSLIDSELQKLNQDKLTPEAQKSDKLTKFRGMIEEHSLKRGRSLFANIGSLGFAATDDADKNDRLQLMLAEKDLLDGLAVQLNAQAQVKRNH